MEQTRFDQWTKAIATQSTRRAVVRAGTRIAYAAPIVAATLALSAEKTAAISGGFEAAATCIPLNADCTNFRSRDCCGDLICRRVVGSGGTLRTCRP